MSAQGELWAITSYFNPQRYRRRLENYRIFRKHLQIPLVAAELSFGHGFELTNKDADIVVRVRDGDVMWQKERLLNLAIAALPTSCRKVVWLDCDLLIEGDQWASRIGQALDEYPLVQPFSTAANFCADADVETRRWSEQVDFSRPGAACAIARGRSAVECMKRPDRVQDRCATGLTWAMRRELIEKHRFYDACIVGGGDHVMTCAAFGCFDELIERQHLNAAQRAHYLAWAMPYFEEVSGRVGFVDATIHHLWHGVLANRRYRERFEGLVPFCPDPANDLVISPGGAWCWNSHKPAMHEYVKDYFAGRKEDG